MLLLLSITFLLWIYHALSTKPVSGKKLWWATFWRTLFDSENESESEENVGKNIFIEEDIVESSEDSDGEETSINSGKKLTVLKSVEYLCKLNRNDTGRYV